VRIDGDESGVADGGVVGVLHESFADTWDDDVVAERGLCGCTPTPLKPLERSGARSSVVIILSLRLYRCIVCNVIPVARNKRLRYNVNVYVVSSSSSSSKSMNSIPLLTVALSATEEEELKYLSNNNSGCECKILT
jgi:hypothetical protein